MDNKKDQTAFKPNKNSRSDFYPLCDGNKNQIYFMSRYFLHSFQTHKF